MTTVGLVLTGHRHVGKVEREQGVLVEIDRRCKPTMVLQ
jgi:hypothetical protein